MKRRRKGRSGKPAASRSVKPETLTLEVATEQEVLIQAIGTLFDDARKAQKLEKATLAERLRKTPPYVTQLLRGDRNMTLRTLAELAYALGKRIAVGFEPLTRPQVGTGGWQHRGATEWRPPKVQKLRVAGGR